MKFNKHIKNIIFVTLSNFSFLLSSVFIGLLLPKILTIEDFGLYKTFTLYISYAGFCSLGLIDGIVLDYGDKNYDDLNKILFRGYFRWYFSYNLLFAVTILSLSLLFKAANYKLIILFLAINLLFNNINGYFQQLSQITQRFSEFSYRKILYSMLNIASVLFLFAYYKYDGRVDYSMYLLLFTIINMIIALWYTLTYRDIIFGKSQNIMTFIPIINHLIRIGFPLLFANLCSTLILTLDRQFINILYDTKTYAIYSFAYNLLSLVTIATSAVSIVVYPILKRANDDKLKQLYPILCEIILVLTSFCLVIYFPLKEFIFFYLPKYKESMTIFSVIFPGLLISAVITIILHNYYKAIGKNIIYFKRSILVLLISCITNYFAYIIFHSILAISISSIISMLIWFYLTETFIRKWVNSNNVKNIIYMILCILIFYLSLCFTSSYIGAMCYILLLSITTYFIYSQTYHDVIHLIKN